MFNGIVNKQGKIVRLIKKSSNSILLLKNNMGFGKKDIGSSLCCNGACLTLTDIDKKNIIYFSLSRETLNRSTFKYSKIGDDINLEKPIVFGKRISGHYVQGHVDTTSKILNIKTIGKSWFVKFSINPRDRKYIVEKGSISINGVSLTISKIRANSFQITIIPHTLKLTNLINLKRGDKVNVEFDMVGKYLNKIYN